MKLACYVLSVGQKMDFDTGDVISTMDLLLEDGTVVNATISAAASEHLIGVFAQEKALVTIRPASDDRKAPDDEGEAYADIISVFGGNTSVIATIPEERSASSPSVAPRSEEWVANPTRRARTVPQDEAGNPIVSVAREDASGFSLRDGVDEDGVPSA
jgi:hypothetical protein